MQKATQDKNVIKITTAAGKDAFYLTSFNAAESMSELFVISANMFTIGSQVSHDAVVGKAAVIELRNAKGGGAARHFHGIVSQMVSLGTRTADKDEQKNYIDYQVTIVPVAATMQHRQNYRIYQQKKVTEIAADLFGQHGVAFSDKTKKSYPKYEYCVQYQENDLEFIQRLFQQEGIYFYFEHSQGNHTLVFADDETVYADVADSPVAHSSGHLSESHISAWQGGLSLAPGSYKRLGYDFEKPSKYPDGEQKKPELPTQSSGEVFEYTGEAECNKRASDLASIQLQSLQKDMNLSSGKSDCRSFVLGGIFAFKKHEDPRLEGKKFVVTKLRTSANVPNQSGAGQSEGLVYSNSFSCVPKDTVYRPTRSYQKPLVQGIQTALVTGDPGDEIHIDKYGRVKVQFDWDREGKKDSKSSCWIRVAQNWAGKKWGAFFFPRVGQEVLVEFINGDPDQPIISGALYNADLMPPYALPADKTQSGIKSRSTKEGGADNFNEIRFEDKKGSELLYLQAEKDHHLHVKNDQKDTILNDRLSDITNNDTIKVGKDRSTDIGKNDTLKVGDALNIEAGKEINIKTGGASITMKSDGSIDIKGTNIKINGSQIALKAGVIKLN
ncbi:type VI secretion system Vgr family protein [Pseudoalteromonas ruthenica]|uniref:type VI secretion system Vgr family protein n=1 Tax=Pseudoalteromonas ruthenica TaxID=151081 RepID=UPI001247F6A2|nr:type VI secretion system tip protein TssI/VgrG [Pseudoalteromonas ruthenica]